MQLNWVERDLRARFPLPARIAPTRPDVGLHPLVHNLIKVNGRSHHPHFFHGAATTSYPAGVL